MQWQGKNADTIFTSLVAAVAVVFALAFEIRESMVGRADEPLSLADLQPCCESASPRPARLLRFAVAPLLTPGIALSGLPAFGRYLAGRIGRPVETVNCRTFAEIEAQIRLGEADVAFLGSGPFVTGREEFGLVPLAVPVVAGSATGRTYLVVPEDGPVRGWADLRGKVMAFTDSLSSSGKLVPTFALTGLGATPDGFFRRVVYTHGVMHSIKAVAHGHVDGASVDGAVFDAAVRQDPSFGRRLRVAWRSAAFGNGPVVVDGRMPGDHRARIAAALTGMRADPAGRQALARLGLDGFERFEPRAYDALAAMVPRRRPR
ncbi:MAG: PhnD/SsuA/transferrin family substrate-binding protein [Candidatus Sericytochromatia bacterium]|nr:PhnD/SsuA/transferrin family substrate-binding protein [Candidatus Tanganyikabacteria bacterium]